MSLANRLKKIWNVFTNKNPTDAKGLSSYYRPDRVRFSRGNERSIITSVYNRLAIDASSVSIFHVQTDSSGRVIDILSSSLNRCLAIEANKDQTGQAFLQDCIMSLLDEGCIAIVPVETSFDLNTGKKNILSIRVGKIEEWFPDHVRVYLYNDKKGQKEYLTLPKKEIGIVENPFFSVMNEPNSTLQRLIHKLNILDSIDEQSGSGKLDLLIQLPYTIKNKLRKEQAEERRYAIEQQLNGSKYGIAYIDGTEKVTQLNRAADNNLMTQIEYLTNLLYGQLGITTEIMNGTASESVMLNYYDRTIEPIISAIAKELKRKFLTENELQNGESIVYINEPFKLVSTTQIASMAETLSRNEILTSNEIRQLIGFMPSNDPKADKLINSNLNQPLDNTESDSLYEQLSDKYMEDLHYNAEEDTFIDAYLDLPIQQL